MAAAGTLATDAQILLAIGANASAAQVLGTNTDIWILMAESDMEAETENAGLVANYADIGAEYKQWLALIASNRAAFYAINQNPNSWQLATTQSKLNVIDAIWQEGKNKLNKADVIANMGL